MSVAAALAAVCLSSGALTTSIPTTAFELRWMHSIEKTQWHEYWRVTPTALTLTHARIATSGAGMEIPDNAVWVNGAYEYPVDLQLSSLTLSHSPFTAQATICAHNTCKSLGDWLPGLPRIAAVTVAACPRP